MTTRKTLTARSLKNEAKELQAFMNARGLSYTSSEGGKVSQIPQRGYIRRVGKNYSIYNQFSTCDANTFMKCLDITQKAAGMIFSCSN